jgi:hypothetical protein
VKEGSLVAVQEVLVAGLAGSEGLAVLAVLVESAALVVDHLVQGVMESVLAKGKVEGDSAEAVHLVQVLVPAASAMSTGLRDSGLRDKSGILLFVFMRLTTATFFFSSNKK